MSKESSFFQLDMLPGKIERKNYVKEFPQIDNNSITFPTTKININDKFELFHPISVKLLSEELQS